MKKSVYLLVTVASVLSLTACGNGANFNSNGQAQTFSEALPEKIIMTTSGGLPVPIGEANSSQTTIAINHKAEKFTLSQSLYFYSNDKSQLLQECVGAFSQKGYSQLVGAASKLLVRPGKISNAHAIDSPTTTLEVHYTDGRVESHILAGSIYDTRGGLVWHGHEALMAIINRPAEAWPLNCVISDYKK